MLNPARHQRRLVRGQKAGSARKRRANPGKRNDSSTGRNPQYHNASARKRKHPNPRQRRAEGMKAQARPTGSDDIKGQRQTTKPHAANNKATHRPRAARRLSRSGRTAGWPCAAAASRRSARAALPPRPTAERCNQAQLAMRFGARHIDQRARVRASGQGQVQSQEEHCRDAQLWIAQAETGLGRASAVHAVTRNSSIHDVASRARNQTRRSIHQRWHVPASSGPSRRTARNISIHYVATRARNQTPNKQRAEEE